MSAHRRPSERDELLDHDADGIREFDNDLPRWWLYGFYFTIVFAAIYIANYHLLPTPVFGSKGMAAEYHAEMELAKAAAASRPQPATGAVALVALTDEQSLTKGKAIFEGQDNVCAACHRPDLGGMVGPNLTDDYWLHGCSVQQVASSIRTGYPTKGMLPFGTGKTLTDTQTNPAAAKTIEPERDLVCR
jgi:cytochrome c oxidase cbb3-type subunit III